VLTLRTDVVPPLTLDALVGAYEAADDWIREDQHAVYGMFPNLKKPVLRHQSFSGPAMPRDGEPYVASFERSKSLEGLPLTAEVARMIRGDTWRCYQFGAGQGFRTHTDSYFGGAASHVLYLTREWRWDWGGLLHVISDDGERTETVLPRMGLVATLTGKDVAHFVSPVAPWAEAPRYVLAVFGR
jgi:hypothetical protein